MIAGGRWHYHLAQIGKFRRQLNEPPPEPEMHVTSAPNRWSRLAAVLLTLGVTAVLAACGPGDSSTGATPPSSSSASAQQTSNPALDKDAVQKAYECGLSLGLEKLKAGGQDGQNLLDAIHATLTGQDLAANRADLRKAFLVFGIDIGPAWISCFKPFFFPNPAGAGAAPSTPTGLTVRADPNDGTVMLLSWNDSSAAVLYFVVSDGVEERNVPVQSSPGSTTYTWTGLQPGSWTCFQVKASNGDTSSSWDPDTAPYYQCAYTSSAALSSATPDSSATPVSLSPSALTGTWEGIYTCAQGDTELRLVIQAAAGGTLTATFNFFAAPDNPGVPSGSYTMTGTYSATGVQLTQDHWINEPPGYMMVDISADPPSQGGTVLHGTITTCGTTFTLTRKATG
jgi:hypothetical protein